MRRHRAATLMLAVAGLGYTTLRGRIRRYVIAEQSMSPALRPGDYVVAVSNRTLARGDIVIFDYPDRVGFELVKRVIGVPGELVTIRDGRVHINGQKLAEDWATGPTLPDAEWPLRKDEIVVLGDNRAVSSGDSRIIGPVALETAHWVVVARYWPPSKAGWISSPASPR